MEFDSHRVGTEFSSSIRLIQVFANLRGALAAKVAITVVKYILNLFTEKDDYPDVVRRSFAPHGRHEDAVAIYRISVVVLARDFEEFAIELFCQYLVVTSWLLPVPGGRRRNTLTPLRPVVTDFLR